MDRVRSQGLLHAAHALVEMLLQWDKKWDVFNDTSAQFQSNMREAPPSVDRSGRDQ